MVLKLSEVGKDLHLSNRQLLRWVKQGKIYAIKLPSGRYRVPERELYRIKMGMEPLPTAMTEISIEETSGSKSSKQKKRKI